MHALHAWRIRPCYLHVGQNVPVYKKQPYYENFDPAKNYLEIDSPPNPNQNYEYVTDPTKEYANTDPRPGNTKQTNENFGVPDEYES